LPSSPLKRSDLKDVGTEPGLSSVNVENDKM